MYFVEDEYFARHLQNELQAYEALKRQKEEKEVENLNLIHSKLEYIDPTPSIHDLFMRFNRKFFWNTLGMVEVVWSHRMTKCAGLCSFEGGRGLCKIALSAPLLSLRPRKDLVETLLHEMIHAYLFVTHNYKDREDHGPEFHKHMLRINKEAGTNITVYHTFYNEVEYYQRHIWRCDGPCQKKKPYFGFVRRAVNRAPGPNDTWWKQHQNECGGTFIKISEPEKKPKKSKKIIVVKPGEKHKDIRDYFSKKGTSQTNNQMTSNIKTLADLKGTAETNIKTNAGTRTFVITKVNKGESTKSDSRADKCKKNKSNQLHLKKTDNVFSEKPDSSCNKKTEKSEDSESDDVRKTVRNKWANKFLNLKLSDDPSSKKIKLHPAGRESTSKVEVQNVEKCNKENTQEHEAIEVTDELKTCPVCNEKVLQSDMNSHLESCLKCSFENEGDEFDDIVCESVPCPVCYKWFPESEMNSHIDECLTLNTLKNGLLDP